MTHSMRDRANEITATMEETEAMWVQVCGSVDDDRVDMLVEAMFQQYALVMEGESNANAIMALVGFISQQVLVLHESSDMSIESAMVLVQIGMQRGVQASLAVKAKHGEL